MRRVLGRFEIPWQQGLNFLKRSRHRQVLKEVFQVCEGLGAIRASIHYEREQICTRLGTDRLPAVPLLIMKTLPAGG